MEKKIFNIDIVDGEYRKFPDAKKNENIQRKCVILSFLRCSLPSMQDVEFFNRFPL